MFEQHPCILGFVHIQMWIFKNLCDNIQQATKKDRLLFYIINSKETIIYLTLSLSLSLSLTHTHTHTHTLLTTIVDRKTIRGSES